MKFFFETPLRRGELMARMHTVRVPHKPPVVLSRDGMARLLAPAGHFKYQVALSAAYGAGLRASEVVELKVVDIDSRRMSLHITAV